MKKIILLLIGCIFFAVSAQAVIYTSDNTYQVDEILYDKKTNMPITGIYQEYSQDGNLVREIPYKNGKREGLDKWYYENGNLEREINYNQGKAVSGYMYDYEGNRTKMTNAHLHNLNKEINSLQ